MLNINEVTFGLEEKYTYNIVLVTENNVLEYGKTRDIESRGGGM